MKCTGRPILRRQRHQNAAARGAVKLGHHQAGDAGGLQERLDLRQRVLADGGVEHQQHRMRRLGIDLLHDANDLLQLVHQLGLVLQPPGGVDQQHVDGRRPSPRSSHRRQGPPHRRHAPRAITGALVRSPQIFSCSTAAARNVSPAASITLRPSARNLAASLPMVVVLPEPLTPTTRMTNGFRAPSIDERLGDRRQHLLDFGRDHRLHLVGGDRLVVAALADRSGDPRRDLGAEIGAQQHVLDVLDHGAVELALGDEIGHGGAERTRGALQPVGKPAPPALFRLILRAVVHVGRVIAVSPP